MSEVLSAHPGAPEILSAHPGALYDGIVRIAEGGLRGMVTLKADLAAAATAITAVTGAQMPEARRIVEGKVSVAWMAPDEVLILCDHAAADRMVADLGAKLGGAKLGGAKLATAHHLAVNVSDARAVFTLQGRAIKDVLGKLTPADLQALAPGEMRRTRLAQIPAAIWFSDDSHATVICFRSVARYAFDLLSMSARPGAEVGHH